jgi:multidrug efflux pump subunit AcrA (membrane-fusion protein)
MSIFFSNRWLYITITVSVIVFVIGLLFHIGNKREPILVTTTVEMGQVRQLVSVSGIAKANQSANLAFPTTGIVDQVLVRTGDTIEAEMVLATLDSRTLYTDRAEAEAMLDAALADRAVLLAGPTSETRSVTNETIVTQELALKTTEVTEAEKIKNAYRTLLSSNLEAYSKDPNRDAVAPIISGTYTCDVEGFYQLELFASQAQSGYSYRLSGLESGTYDATTRQPSPLATCGLEIQFDKDSNYTRNTWIISVPNTRSANYLSNLNAYELAVTQANNAIKTAEQNLIVARVSAEDKNAPARSENIAKANAVIAQARARLNRIDTTIAKQKLVAPFSGTITNVSVLPGEIVTTNPIITLLADTDFEVIARIPEIDIGKLLVGQRADLLFDARPQEILSGEVRFISPKATEIDGVAYYEAFITLDQLPQWMRSGLNADIEIILTEEISILRVPRRFITKTATGHTAHLLQFGSISIVPIEIILEGNDGFVAISGVNEGDILVAP